MSSFTTHILLPPLLALASGMFPRRTVLKWAPFAVLSDLDFLFNFFGYYVLKSDLLLHRAIGHNVFIGLPTLIVAVWLWHRMLQRDPELRFAGFRDRWSAFGHVRWGYATVLITAFLWSHVLLDMFQGGVTPFYPFWNQYVYPRWFVWVNTTTGQPRLDTGVRSGTGAPALSPEYPWLYPEEFAIWMMVLVVSVAALVHEGWHWSKEKRGQAGTSGTSAAPPAVEEDDGDDPA